MSKLDVTTRDLFMRLGSTSQKRSARADAVFRRLRVEQHERVADALSRAARLLDPAILEKEKDSVETTPRRKSPKVAP